MPTLESVATSRSSKITLVFSPLELATCADLLQISRMKSWTEFLVGSTLYTAQQYGSISLSASLAHRYTVLRETANLLNISNQTNLAIKGIIAIKAMSVMSEVAGQSAAYSVSA